MTDPQEELRLLDQLAAQHLASRRWGELANTLGRKATLVTDPAARAAVHLELADVYAERLQNPVEANRALEAVLDADPDHADAARRLRESYERRRDYEKLIGLDRRAVARLEDPQERLERALGLARLAAEKARRPELLAQLWSDVLELEPGNADALAALEKLYLAAEDWDGLAVVYERQAEGAPDDAERRARNGKLAQLHEEQRGDPAAAIAVWREIGDVDPDDKAAWTALRRLLVAQAAWEELEVQFLARGDAHGCARLFEAVAARAAVEQQLELWPRVARLQRDRLNDWDRARAAFEQVLALDPRNLAAAEALIPLYQARDELQKLVVVVAIQLEHTTVPVLRQSRIGRLAAIYEHGLEDAAAAFAWRLFAVEESPAAENLRAEAEGLASSTRAWPQLVETYRRICDRLTHEGGDHGATIAALLETVARVEALELGSPEAAVADVAGRVEEREARPDDVPGAIRCYLDLLAEDPTHAGAREGLRGYLDDPRLLEVLAADTSGDPASVRRSAELLEQAFARPAAALLLYGRALKLEPTDAGVAAHVERLAAALGAWDDVAQIYRDVLGGRLPLALQAAFRVRLGALYHERLGADDRAVATYRRVLDIDRANRAALAGLAVVHEAQQAWPDLNDVLSRHRALLHADAEPDPAQLDALDLRLGRLAAERLGDDEAAVSCYRDVLVRDPAHEGALTALRDLFTREGAAAGLWALLDAPLQAELSTRMARLQSRSAGDPERAIALWRQVLELRGDDEEALIELADLLERALRWRELLPVLDRLISLTSAPADELGLLRRQAQAWRELPGEEREAAPVWRRIAELSPRDLDALAAMVARHRGAHEPAELADVLGRLLEVIAAEGDGGRFSGDDVLKMHLELATLEDEILGRPERAIVAWRRVLELAPGYGPALAALESLYVRGERWIDCAAIVEARARAAGDRPSLELLQQAAWLLEDKAGDRARAAALYEEIRRAEPTHAVASAQLEAIYRHEGQWGAVADVLLSRVEQTEDRLDRVGLRIEVARIHAVERQDRKAAFSVLREAFRDDPTHGAVGPELEALATQLERWDVLLEDYRAHARELERAAPALAAELWLKIADASEQRVPRLDRAVEALEAAVRLEPKLTGALDRLASLHHRRGALEAVEARRREAEAERDPARRAEAFLTLARQIEVELEDRAGAIAAYEAALSADPSSARALRALARLGRTPAVG